METFRLILTIALWVVMAYYIYAIYSLKKRERDAIESWKRAIKLQEELEKKLSKTN